MRRRLVWLALASVAAACIAGLCRSGASVAAASADPLAALTARDSAAPAGRLLLLGSSTLARLDTSSLPKVLNLALSGDTVPGLTRRLRGYRSPHGASAAVLLIGLNDLMAGCDAAAVDFAPLLDTLPPDLPLAWSGVQGLSPTQQQRCGGRIAALTEVLNARIRQACAARRGCTYLDHPIGPAPTAAQSDMLHAGDGIHLSALAEARLLHGLQAFARAQPAPAPRGAP